MLLHALRKDTGKISEADIAIAVGRWEDFKSPDGRSGSRTSTRGGPGRALTG